MANLTTNYRGKKEEANTVLLLLETWLMNASYASYFITCFPSPNLLLLKMVAEKKMLPDLKILNLTCVLYK